MIDNIDANKLKTCFRYCRILNDWKKISNEFNNNLHSISISVYDHLDDEIELLFIFDFDDNKLDINIEYEQHIIDCYNNMTSCASNTHYITLNLDNYLNVVSCSENIKKNNINKNDNKDHGQKDNEFIYKIINDSLTEYIKLNNLDMFNQIIDEEKNQIMICDY